MVTGKKIIVIQIIFKKLYFENHEMNLKLLSIEVWDYASSTSLQEHDRKHTYIQSHVQILRGICDCHRDR